MPGYDCDGCGACCRTFPVFASAADARRELRVASEARALADHLAAPGWVYQLFPLPFHETCCFLDGSARCTIYPTPAGRVPGVPRRRGPVSGGPCPRRPAAPAGRLGGMK